MKKRKTINKRNKKKRKKGKERKSKQKNKQRKKTEMMSHRCNQVFLKLIMNVTSCYAFKSINYKDAACFY